MQFTITGEDEYGEQVELTLESALEGNSVELTINGDDAIYPLSFDATDLRKALSFASAELSER